MPTVMLPIRPRRSHRIPELARGPTRSRAPEHWRQLVGLWEPAVGRQGSILYDWSGYGHHGVLTDMDPATDWQPDAQRRLALHLDGTDGHVLVPDSPALSPSTALTVLAWIYQDANASDRVLMMKGSQYAVDWSWMITTMGDGENDRLQIYITDALDDVGNNTAFTQLGFLPGATWLHLGVVYDGTQSTHTDRVRIYGNGIAASLTFTGTIPVTLQDATGPLDLGQGLSRYWNGSFGTIAIYTRAMSASEVLDHYLRSDAALQRRFFVVQWGEDVATTVGSFPPDAIAASTNLSGVVAAVQDDPDSPDGTYLTASSATAVTDLRVSFPTPPANPYGGQNFQAYVRKTTGTPHPTLTAELRQDNTLRATLATDTLITSTSGQLLTLPWSASALAAVLDGSDVELRLVSAVGQAPGALPAYVQAGTGYGSATLATTHSVARPAGVTAGNLLIIVIQATNTNGNADATVTTADWNAFPGNPYAGTNNRAILYWKIAESGTDTAGGTVGVTGTGGTGTDGLHARIFEFSAANGWAATPVESIASLSGTTATGDTVIDMPTVTPTGLNRLAVAISIVNDDAGNPVSGTGESGGDWTQAVAEFESNLGSGGTIDIQTSDQSGGGAISGGTVAYGATGDNWVSVAFALVPASVNVNTVEYGAIEWNYRHLELPPSAIKIGSLMMMGMGR